MESKLPQPDPAHKHGPRCKKLQEILKQATDVANNCWAIDRMKCRLEHLVGYSISDENGRQALACRVSDAKNLQELAKAAGRPQYEVRHYFAVLRQLLEREGGISGLASVLELHKKLIDWVTKTGYPNLPLKGETERSVADFFRNLHVNYSWYMLYDADRPSLPLLLSPETIAKTITGCPNKSELAVSLNVGVSRLDTVTETLTQGRPQMYKLYHEIAVLARDMGFIDIEPEPEEDPKKVLAATNVNGITANSQKPKNGNKSDSTPASKNGVQAKPLPLALDDRTILFYGFLSDGIEAERRGLSSVYREAIEEKLGESILDVHARMRFSGCVARARTMTEIANILHMTVPNMLELYQGLGESIGEFFNGTDGVSEFAVVSQSLHTFLVDTGYPCVPLKKNDPKYIQGFFEDLQKKVGNKYLTHFQSSVLPLTEDPKYLAKILTESKSEEELRKTLKCTDFEIKWARRHLADIFDKYTLEFKLLERAMQLMKDFGLDHNP